MDASDGDSLSLVGGGKDGDFEAAVFRNEGCIYGRILKYNPTDHSISYIGRKFEEHYHWTGAVLEDGNIYVVNDVGRILKIDMINMINKDQKIIALKPDKCIHFPPAYHERLLKYNPSTQSISSIGEFIESKVWLSGLLALDGYLLCSI